MGQAPRQRVRLSMNELRHSLSWCLSHFHDGPTALTDVFRQVASRCPDGIRGLS